MTNPSPVQLSHKARWLLEEGETASNQTSATDAMTSNGDEDEVRRLQRLVTDQKFEIHQLKAGVGLQHSDTSSNHGDRAYIVELQRELAEERRKNAISFQDKERQLKTSQRELMKLMSTIENQKRKLEELGSTGPDGRASPMYGLVTTANEEQLASVEDKLKVYKRRLQEAKDKNQQMKDEFKVEVQRIMAQGTAWQSLCEEKDAEILRLQEIAHMAGVHSQVAVPANHQLEEDYKRLRQQYADEMGSLKAIQLESENEIQRLRSSNDGLSSQVAQFSSKLMHMEAEVAGAKAIQQDSSELQRLRQQYTEDVATLRSTISETEAELTQMSLKYDDAKTALQKLQTESVSNSHSLLDAQGKISARDAQIAVLEQRLKTLEHELQASRVGVSTQVDGMEKTISQLRAALLEKDVANAKAQELSQKTQRHYEEEISSLRCTLSETETELQNVSLRYDELSMRTTDTASANQTIVKSKDELIGILQSRIASLENDISVAVSLPREDPALKAELEVVRKQAQLAQEQYEQKTLALEQKQRDDAHAQKVVVEELQSKLADVTHKYQALQSENDQCLEALKAAKLALEQHQEDTSAKDALLERQKSQISVLEHNMKLTSSEESQRCAKLQHDLNELRTQYETDVNTLTLLSEESEKDVQMLRDKVSSFGAEVEILQGEKEQLTSQLNQYELKVAELEEARAFGARESEAKLHDEIAGLRSEITKLRANHQATLQTYENQKHQELAEKSALIEELNARIVQDQLATRTQHDQMSSQYTKALTESQQKDETIRILNEKLSQMQGSQSSQNESLQQQISSLQALVQEYQAEVSNKDHTISSLRDTVKVYEASKGGETEISAALQRQVNEQNTQLQWYEEELGRLLQQCANDVKELQDINQTKDDLQHKYDSLDVKYATLQSSCNTYQQKCEIVESELNRVRGIHSEEMMRLRISMEETQSKYDSLHRASLSPSRDLDAALSRVATLESQLKDVHSQMAAMESKLSASVRNESETHQSYREILQRLANVEMENDDLRSTLKLTEETLGKVHHQAGDVDRIHMDLWDVHGKLVNALSEVQKYRQHFGELPRHVDPAVAVSQRSLSPQPEMSSTTTSLKDRAAYVRRELQKLKSEVTKLSESEK